MPLRGRIHNVIFAGLLLTGTLSFCAAEELQEKIHFSGFVSTEVGQFVNYKYHSIDWRHKWLNKNLLGLNLSTSVHPRIDVSLGIVGALYYNTMPDMELQNQSVNALKPISGLSIDRADIMLNLSPQVEDSLLEIGIGLFPYKYNHDVRNLGEYLFRTGCYPGYINQEGFDAPFSHVAGIRVTNNLFDSWRNELFLTTELYLPPYNDFSLTYITDLSSRKKVFNLGAGIQFFRCFSVDKSLTQPEVYKDGISEWQAPNFYDLSLDSIGVNNNGETVYDSTMSYYTFAGTKLMVRLAFDLKPLLGVDIFSPEDLKLYSEVAILGLKNYPANTDQYHTRPGPDSGGLGPNLRYICEYGYDKLIEKMPIMVGLNIPTFKLLDVLSLEVEYYGKKYVNAVPIAASNILEGAGGYYPINPFPYYRRPDAYYKKTFYEKGAAQWKWSLYAKRTLAGRFTITGQGARDHIRTVVEGVSTGNLDQEETFVKKKHWYWVLKLGANF